MAWYLLFFAVIGAVSAIVGVAWAVDAWILPRVTGKHKELDKRIERIESKIGQIAEYLDGLPQIADQKRKAGFEKAYHLYKEQNYREAIPAFEACFAPEATLRQRTALHVTIGNSFLRLSELEEAMGHYKQAETLAMEANDKEGLSAAVGNLGNVYLTKGDLDKALEYYQQALKIDREIGKREGEANDLGNMGIVYGIKGELDKALEHHQQALKIDREIGNREGEASDLGNMGNVYRIKGELDKALEYYQQALEIFEDMGANLEAERTKAKIRILVEAKAKLPYPG